GADGDAETTGETRFASAPHDYPVSIKEIIDPGCIDALDEEKIGVAWKNAAHGRMLFKGGAQAAPFTLNDRTGIQEEGLITKCFQGEFHRDCVEAIGSLNPEEIGNDERVGDTISEPDNGEA